MSAESMPAAPLCSAAGVQRASRSFHLYLPLLIGALAAAGALGQLNAASLDQAAVNAASADATLERARALRLVEDAHWLDTAGLVDAATPAEATAQPAPDSSGSALRNASFADRLRGDPVQTASAPVAPVATPSAPVKLTKDQRAIARYITRSYRVASEPVEYFVHHAFKAAREYRLDPHLILAVMAIESGFDPTAESSAGAQGLMQVHTKVHTSKFAPFGGVDAAYDPVANIKVGTRILSEYVNRYGDVAAGLKAYVGAALLPSDGGYGNKVLTRRNEFEAVVRPVEAPPLQAANDNAAPSAAVEVSGSANPAGGASAGL